jgi:hypothetical protein
MGDPVTQKSISRTTFFCPFLGILVFILSLDHGDPVTRLSALGSFALDITHTPNHQWPESSRYSRFLPSANSISVQLLPRTMMERPKKNSRSLARFWTGYPSSEYTNTALYAQPDDLQCDSTVADNIAFWQTVEETSRMYRSMRSSTQLIPGFWVRPFILFYFILFPLWASDSFPVSVPTAIEYLGLKYLRSI